MNQAFHVSQLSSVCCLLAWVSLSALLISPASAQVNGPGPSPASEFDYVLNLPGDEAAITGVDFESIGGAAGETTQLNSSDGGAVGDWFDALAGSEVNISGGTVGHSFDAKAGCEVNITGGTVGQAFHAESGSQVNISGGSVGGGAVALAGSAVTITGGAVGDSFRAFDGSAVTISGGTLGGGFSAAGSDVELIGGEFRLDGADYSGGTLTLEEEGVFTGTLLDGSVFIFRDFRVGGSDDIFSGVTLTPAALPIADLNPIVIDDSAVSSSSGLRAGQTLTLQAGGSLGENFAVVDASLNVEGGTLGDGAGAVNSEVSISDGTVGNGFEIFSGSEVNINGGNVGNSSAFDGSEVNISGGTLGSFRALKGSAVNVSGGTFGNRFEAFPNSEVNISGGTFGGRFIASAGRPVELIGGEFRLNGTDFSGSTISLTEDDIFTGTLTDGSVFIFVDTTGQDVLSGVTLTMAALPIADLNPIVVNDSVGIGPSGLRASQTLTLKANGSLGHYFTVVDASLNVEEGTLGDAANAFNSQVNISGGTVGDNFDAFFGSEINISGGTVGDNFGAFPGSEVNISGGTVGTHFDAKSGSVVNINGATVGDSFGASSGSEVNISGGTFGDYFRTRSGSVVNISGGTVGDFIEIKSGSMVNISGGIFGDKFNDFDVDPGSTVNISGSEFFVDGLELDTLPSGEAFTITDRDVTLSGLLANGEPFSFDLNSTEVTFPPSGFFSSDATLTVTRVSPVILGDVNRDGVVDFLDIAPLIAVLSSQTYQTEADIDQNQVVNFLDITPFIGVLSGQ